VQAFLKSKVFQSLRRIQEGGNFPVLRDADIQALPLHIQKSIDQAANTRFVGYPVLLTPTLESKFAANEPLTIDQEQCAIPIAKRDRRQTRELAVRELHYFLDSFRDYRSYRAFTLAHWATAATTAARRPLRPWLLLLLLLLAILHRGLRQRLRCKQRQRCECQDRSEFHLHF
jgi:hypothetical protein